MVTTSQTRTIEFGVGMKHEAYFLLDGHREPMPVGLVQLHIEGLGLGHDEKRLDDWIPGGSPPLREYQTGFADPDLARN